ncbi:hypothetical protein [Vibrio methylphosphonaticus]|uniref:hypothetical protein n=1 Tax=Vibrio methylphosphonaticus TaxID=2946866 RepID=UPI00202A3911|nr:hypothetical protein [Vibrio methylphosphonaticus]MCL9777484.1 hypothetical protein [Vibrio methylphosphonaticus]
MTKIWLSKKTLLATAISTVILSGCGGDSSETSSVPNSGSFTVTAIDGYLQNAILSVDTNNDGICDLILAEQTDANGQLNIDNKYQANQICVNAIKNQTIDSSRGPVTKAFELKAPQGSTVVTPLTNLVVQKVQAGTQLDEAKLQVVSSLTDAGLVVSAEEVFGDYVKQSNKHLEVIGETLVDHAQGDNGLDIAKEVADSIKDKTSDELTDYQPSISSDGQGSIIVTPNHRPNQLKEYSNVTIELGQMTDSIDLTAWFNDKDGDQVTYSIETNDQGPALSIVGDGSTIISTEATVAGTFTYYVFATDTHSAKSRPVKLTLTVTSPDLPPTVNGPAQSELQTIFDTAELMQGIESDASYAVDTLFDDDGESEVTLSVITDAPGLIATIRPAEKILVLTGTPSKAGAYTISVSAKDAVNADKAEAIFNISVAESNIEVPHILEGQVLYKIETDEFYNEVYCQSIKLEDGKIWFIDDNEVTQPIDPLSACAEPTIEIGRYTSDGETISGSYINDEGVESTISIKTDLVDEQSENNTLSPRYVVSINDVSTSTSEQSSDIWYSEKLDAENHLDSSGNVQDFVYYYPMNNGGYNIGKIGIELQSSDADLYFESGSVNWTCNDVLSNFKTFALYDGNKQLVAQSTECYDNNSTPYPTEKAGDVGIDFDFDTTLNKDERYTIAAIHSDNNTIISFGASVLYTDHSLSACSAGDSGWNDNLDQPESLHTIGSYINALENCGQSANSLSIADLFSEQNRTVKLRRIDKNANETEYMQLYQEAYQGNNMYLALDDATIRTNWSHNTSYGTLEYGVTEGVFEFHEALAITAYDPLTGLVALKGFTKMTDWDDLGLGTKGEGYGHVFSGVYEVVFNSH